MIGHDAWIKGVAQLVKPQQHCEPDNPCTVIQNIRSWFNPREWSASTHISHNQENLLNTVCNVNNSGKGSQLSIKGSSVTNNGDQYNVDIYIHDRIRVCLYRSLKRYISHPYDRSSQPDRFKNSGIFWMWLYRSMVVVVVVGNKSWRRLNVEVYHHCSRNSSHFTMHHPDCNYKPLMSLDQTCFNDDVFILTITTVTSYWLRVLVYIVGMNYYVTCIMSRVSRVSRVLRVSHVSRVSRVSRVTCLLISIYCTSIRNGWRHKGSLDILDWIALIFIYCNIRAAQ